MSKTPPGELAELVTEELVTYLGSGALNQHQLGSAINYSDLEIESFDQLKELHFVLHGGVVEYINRLPERLRRVKSVNESERALTHGEVRGRIDWQRTTQERAQRGNDPSIFSIEAPEVEYDIPENRVVKKLLAAIARPLSEDLKNIGQDWREEWSDRDIVELERTLKSNVYLDALPDPADISLDNRDLETARRARQPLYQKGESLYRLYEDLMNNRFEREAVRNLLEETMVSPNTDYRLFELFCLFGEIHRQDAGFRWKRIQPGMDEMAVLESDTRRLSVFFDQNGPLQFFESYPSSEDLKERDAPEMVIRQARALEDHADHLSQFLDRDTQDTFYSGRPDFLILDHSLTNSDQELQRAVLGEVKYTRSKSTFSSGLRELLEYVHFAQANSEYLFDKGGIPVQGILCTDGVKTDVDEFGIIKHHTTKQIRDFFPKNGQKSSER